MGVFKGGEPTRFRSSGAAFVAAPCPDRCTPILVPIILWGLLSGLFDERRELTGQVHSARSTLRPTRPQQAAARPEF